jgi:hypothetical protein
MKKLIDFSAMKSATITQREEVKFGRGKLDYRWVTARANVDTFGHFSIPT